MQSGAPEISQWVEQYGDDLFSWAYYKTRNKEVAEDLVQESFLAAVRSYDGFKKQSNPKTWLFTILNNKIIDYYRSAAHNRSVNMSSLSSEDDDGLFDKHGGWLEDSQSAWEEDTHLLDRPEFLKTLEGCLNQLSEKHKAVTLAKFFHHKKGKQISKELNISSSNLWQIVHRSKLQLKKCLDLKWKDE